MPSTSQIATIVQDYFNCRDADGLLRLWTDDFQFEGPGRSFTGKEQMLAQERNLWRAFPDIVCQVTTFVADDQRVTLFTRMTGTHQDALRLAKGTIVPATGRYVDFTLSVHMTLRDGQIAHERLFYDTANFLWQLGLLND